MVAIVVWKRQKTIESQAVLELRIPRIKVPEAAKKITFRKNADCLLQGKIGLCRLIFVGGKP
ncbi:MAG: hypothetical protein KDJ69_01825 [Nitratireductor sp.]|nr:hypothetical protein [Nitratireductor sp.]